MSQKCLYCLGLVTLAACLFGCTDNADENVCVPVCDGKMCGPDGCGKSCGVCNGGNICSADGLCVNPATPVCIPSCGADVCGDDGCGGSCGSCSGDQVCTNGTCETPSVACQPDCIGRSCGDDGCGGSCGTCFGDQVCANGTCETPSVACQPDCTGRTCGDDGCGGSCGTCSDGSVCRANACIDAQSIRYVEGSIFYEQQTITLGAQNLPEFGKIVKQPAGRMQVALYDAELQNLLGEGVTKADGSYRIQLTRPPRANDVLFISPTYGVGDSIKLAVLQAATTTPFDVWSWHTKLDTDLADGNTVAPVVITTSAGSGAINLYETALRGYDFLLNSGFESSLADLESLAIVWKENMTWACGSCFLHVKTYSKNKLAFDNMIAVDGASQNESAWGDATTLHEFGHYVLNHRRDNTTGGAHALSTENDARLAWSEGWATFFSLALQSFERNELVTTYARLLGSTGSFFIDYPLFSITHQSGRTSDLPEPDMSDSAGIKQLLAESWVTSILLDIWDGSDYPDDLDSLDPIAVSLRMFWKTLASERYVKSYSYNYIVDDPAKLRTVNGVNLVDFLDALVCNSVVDKDLFFKWLDNSTTFPYDNTPVCVKK